MRKLVGLLLFSIVIISIYLFFSLSAKDYSIEYKIDTFTVLEKYHKKDRYYSFTLSKDDMSFEYIYETRYSNDRKLVKELKIKEDGYTCVKPVVKKMSFQYQCYDDEYKSPYLVGLLKSKSSKKVNTYNSINIYSKDYDYYIWNGHGITDILSKKEYNFIVEEMYDNNLSIKLDDYILFANYNKTRTFDSFYIFDYDKKVINQWSFDYDIDFDSYFMGEVEGFVYLFDRKNMVQYKINVKDETIEVSSDKEGALFFEGKWGTKPNKDLKYSDYFMEEDNLYDYILFDNKLYININNSKNNILLSNLKVDDILEKDKEAVYYLVEDSIYVYTIKDGEYKLLDYFEWNFSYKNKVYIFD